MSVLSLYIRFPSAWLFYISHALRLGVSAECNVRLSAVSGGVQGFLPCPSLSGSE